MESCILSLKRVLGPEIVSPYRSLSLSSKIGTATAVTPSVTSEWEIQHLSSLIFSRSSKSFFFPRFSLMIILCFLKNSFLNSSL